MSNLEELDTSEEMTDVENVEESGEVETRKDGFVAYPHINQFRQIIKHVRNQASFQGIDDEGNPIYDTLALSPTLAYEGTVKLHGTNAALTFMPDGSIKYQSRSRLLTPPQNDNAGFATYMKEVVSESALWDILYQAIGKDEGGEPLINIRPLRYPITVFGEWCGGNIQKGIALNQLPQMFVAFSVKETQGGNGWLFLQEGFYSEAHRIYDIQQFPVYELEIDFNRPEEANNQMVDITLAVEAQCPVAKQLGKEGIGEGVVWKCVTPGYEGSEYWFKVKGEKHSVSKVKTLNVVDVEKANNLADFTNQTVTTNRLSQGLDVLRERGLDIDMKNTKAFIDWVTSDVCREEADLVVASQIDMKDVGKAVAQKAAIWFKAKVLGTV